MKGYVEILIYIALAFSSTTVAQEKVNFGSLELDQKLLKGSRWAIEQEQLNDKIEVYHAIEVVDISKVDVESMSIRLEIHLLQRWDAKDMELPEGLFKPDDVPDTFIRAQPAILNSLWSPDSYIPNARETKIASLTTTQSVVNIFQNKSIVYKARLYTILGCAFSFQWYPLDRQTCDLTIESYKFSSDMVQYLWEDQQPPLIITDLKLLQYDMILPVQHSNGSSPRWGTSGTYPYVMLRFAFERQLAHHMIQVFTPTILVVILSWFSFWLGMDAIPGRVSLLITCMLTLVTMHTGLKGSIPPVNYIKMMDVWMVGCMAFVFAALFEFIIVKYLHWKKHQELKNTEEREVAVAKYWIDNPKLQGQIEPNSQQLKAFNNPYLEFYKKMNDKELMGSEVPYPFAVMLKQLARSEKPKPGWEDFQINPGMMTPLGGFFHPHQHQMVHGQNGHPELQWPFGPKKRPVWLVIDRVSRVAFPLMFGVFNAIYWSVLFVGAANQ